MELKIYNLFSINLIIFSEVKNYLLLLVDSLDLVFSIYFYKYFIHLVVIWY